MEIMSKLHDRIDGRLRAFIEEQPIFFVATAPRDDGGHINISPKGRAGTLVVLDETTVAYLDFGGSHAETIAHLRENGRIVGWGWALRLCRPQGGRGGKAQWCAFSGPPNIVRVHGTGEPIFRDDPRSPASARTPTDRGCGRSS